MTEYPFNGCTGSRDGEYLCGNPIEDRELGFILLPKLEAWVWGLVVNQVEVCSQLSGSEPGQTDCWWRRESCCSGRTFSASSEELQEETLEHHLVLVLLLCLLLRSFASHPLPWYNLKWEGILLWINLLLILFFCLWYHIIDDDVNLFYLKRLMCKNGLIFG